MLVYGCVYVFVLVRPQSKSDYGFGWQRSRTSVPRFNRLMGVVRHTGAVVQCQKHLCREMILRVCEIQGGWEVAAPRWWLEAILAQPAGTAGM